MKRSLYFTGVLAFALMGANPAHATRIQEVTSSGGIKAWLVEDHKLPVIAMHFAFRGGVEQDPVDKQGLANLAMNLMTEGAGTTNATAFQQRLADHSIAMNFSAERDALTGSLKSLSENRQEAFDLLSMALTQPRVEPKDFERERNQQLIALRTQFSSPDWQSRFALFQKIFSDHPYSERRLGSVKTLAGLTRKDVKKFIAEHLARDNVLIAVAGDISPAELARTLDQSFGKLPRHARLAPVSDIEVPQEPSIVMTPREGTQTALLFAMPGPKDDSPDWYATQIANYILGGGGFSSRLMQDVRDKKGLTYGIDTGLSSAEHGGLIMGQAATDNAKTREAWEIVLATMRHFYEDGVTPAEIAAAKDYLTGSLPLSLTSTDRIARVLVNFQIEHRTSDYLDRRNDLIRSVTPDEVQAVIRHWFNPDHVTLSMVGMPEGMAPTETRDLVRE
jgi:zinc protease